MLWPQFWEYQSVLIQSLLEWMMMTMMMHRPAWQRHSGQQRLVRSQPAKQQFLWRKPIMRQSSSKRFTEQMRIAAKKNKKKQQPFTELWLPPASARHTHSSRLRAAPRRCWCRRPPCWCWSRSSACGRCRSSRSLTPDHLGKHRKCKQRWMELECRFGSTEVRRCFSWTDDRFISLFYSL